MALATYNDLKTSIANFLARDDLTSNIDDFIDLTEARLSRELYTRFDHDRVTASTTAGDQYISLPTDLRKIETIRLNTSPRRVLRYYTPNSLDSNFTTSSNGTPQGYSIIGSEIKLAPTPDSVLTLEMIYSKTIEALSDSNTSNTILTRHPDVYLYGALHHASVFLLDEVKARQYDELFTRAIQEIVVTNDKERYGSALAMKDDYTKQLITITG